MRILIYSHLPLNLEPPTLNKQIAVDLLSNYKELIRYEAIINVRFNNYLKIKTWGRIFEKITGR